MAKTMDWFSFQECNFAIQKCKESTGRVVMHKEFRVVNSYTLECSFCGPTKGLFKDTHFSQKLLIESGWQFGKAICKLVDQSSFNEAMQEVEARIQNLQLSNPL